MTSVRQSALRNKSKKRRKTFVPRLQTCPQKHGVVSKIRIVTPKKPNSARRKVARVKLSNRLFVSAKIIGQGHNLQSYSHVLVRGGRANDLPGVRYTMIKGVLDFSWEEDSPRSKTRSKYGIALEHIRVASEDDTEEDAEDES